MVAKTIENIAVKSKSRPSHLSTPFDLHSYPTSTILCIIVTTRLLARLSYRIQRAIKLFAFTPPPYIATPTRPTTMPTSIFRRPITTSPGKPGTHKMNTVCRKLLHQQLRPFAPSSSFKCIHGTVVRSPWLKAQYYSLSPFAQSAATSPLELANPTHDLSCSALGRTLVAMNTSSPGQERTATASLLRKADSGSRCMEEDALSDGRCAPYQTCGFQLPMKFALQTAAKFHEAKEEKARSSFLRQAKVSRWKHLSLQTVPQGYGITTLLVEKGG